MLLSRWHTLCLFGITGLLIIYYYQRTSIPTASISALESSSSSISLSHSSQQNPIPHLATEKIDWAHLPIRYPVKDLKKTPTTSTRKLPKVQGSFPPESQRDRLQRLHRLSAVKSNFTHAWNGYREHAWLHDEVQPISGKAQDPFGGWAATLVDALGQLKLF
jgi:mannosyl-oligosaccharide alpha-1,2-mannosidase